MCTLTWTHRRTEDRSGDADGYRLFFNRDELRSRGAEVPPRIEERGGVRYVSPADSDAGGTWIAANEYGITVALLNGYIVSRGPDRETWTSRGELVRSLADLRSVREAWGRLSPRLFEPYRPAVVAVIGPRSPSLLARWDGLTLAIDGRAERQLPVASSSFEQDEVQLARRRLFDELVPPRPDGGPPDSEALLSFQNHVTPEGPNAYTPTMARTDAATRSQCAIEVGPDRIRFRYTPGPPHATAAQPPIELARLAP